MKQDAAKVQSFIIKAEEVLELIHDLNPDWQYNVELHLVSKNTHPTWYPIVFFNRIPWNFTTFSCFWGLEHTSRAMPNEKRCQIRHHGLLPVVFALSQHAQEWWLYKANTHPFQPSQKNLAKHEGTIIGLVKTGAPKTHPFHELSIAAADLEHQNTWCHQAQI